MRSLNRTVVSQNKIEFRGSPKADGYRAKGLEDGGVNGGVSGGVSEGVNALFELIRNTPGLRTAQISEAMGIPVRTLQRWIQGLRGRNKIEFKGSPRTGGYHVKD